jgi:hypothetical protein
LNLKQASVLTYFSHLRTFQSLNPFPQDADFISLLEEERSRFHFYFSLPIQLLSAFTDGRSHGTDGYYLLTFKVGWSLARLVGFELN